MRQRRYPSDTSIGEWALLEPLLPTPACQLSTGGRPEKWPRRAIVDAIRYVVDTGCRWRALPADFPPFQTVFGCFSRWRAAGIFNLIRDQLRRQVRRAMRSSPHPVAAVIDSQSVKVAATVPRSTSGFDPGKKIPGRKRHIVCDVKGLLLFVMVTPASTHDAVAAKEVLRRNARDYETRPEHSEAMLTLAAITLMTRRLTRQTAYPTAATPRPTTAVQAA
ncbi:IS5 family transposase [Streptomyces sp. HP-A2021]|uniref:IS5 family transposase n=1 Tax=Streptomyces sp. HP-A2021 TaxID=2927875 RepID=UPI001FAE9F01|nr:IS5 family transposase [Streptomyces sp. HP-A2021]UOB08321.1 IS5 family transposase [Streptomyces sp. HP-A2021]